jgi:uncharacterized repeat protein (TIGR03803 family)
MKRTFDVLGRLNGKRAYVISALCATTAIAVSAQTFTTLHGFDSTDGAFPAAVLVQATNGDLYGTTPFGGANNGGGGNNGTVFKITPSGKLTTLHSFTSTDGAQPYAGLVQTTNGDLYGTTLSGGVHLCNYAITGLNGVTGCGTLFKITPSGKLTTLYDFCSQTNCTDGANPVAGLVQATNGDFYGTTVLGGANLEGTIFKITPRGKLTTVYSFCAQDGCADGAEPVAGLVQAANGDFYGTTLRGGANNTCYGDYGAVGAGCGTVFKITPSGKLTSLYSFCPLNGCIDGANPQAALVQATNGDFYGTTFYGGASDACSNGYEGESEGCGTVFKITPSGKLTSLYSFCTEFGCPDGEIPTGLIQATNGDFYGATSGIYAGQIEDNGTIFKITPSGKLTTIYGFCPPGGDPSNCPHGAKPLAGLLQATNGDFYGTTIYGGLALAGDGTIFSLSVGLGPFVETLPTHGKVGATIEILGTDLTGATGVTFNGTVATFTVNSSGTAISTIIPTGATTGPVQVVTPNGTLSSKVPFRVP